MYIPHEVISSSLFMIIPYITDCPFFFFNIATLSFYCKFIISPISKYKIIRYIRWNVFYSMLYLFIFIKY